MSFTLPDSSAIVLAGTPTQFTYSGENYNGYKVPLSSPITMYAGTLGINARNYDEYGNILYSFPFEQTINATASADSIEVPITVAQYNSFMAMLTTYLNAYDSHLVRKYDTLTLANADIANLALLSVVLIKNESGNYDLYRKNDTTTLAKVSSQDFINLYNASIKSITNTLVDGVLTTQLIKENNTTLSALIDLKNAFYLKSQVYTKQECDNLFLTIQSMSQYATNDYVNSTFATISALSDTNTLAQSAYDLASAKANTYVFDTYELMKTALASASATKYHVGDNLLIVALDTPDYWVKKSIQRKVAIMGIMKWQNKKLIYKVIKSPLMIV